MPYVLDDGVDADPMVAAVQYGLEHYGVRQTRSFIDRRGPEWAAETRAKARALLKDRARATGQFRDATATVTEARRPKAVSTSARTRTGPYSDATKLVKVYGYCGSVCNLVGRVEIELRTNLDPNLYMGGDIDVISGPAVAVQGADCRVMYERTGWPDSTVFTWTNCENVENANFYSRSHIVLVQNSPFYGSYSAKYHNTYSFRVDPLGTPPAIVLSGDSATWKNPSSGGRPTFPA